MTTRKNAVRHGLAVTAALAAAALGASPAVADPGSGRGGEHSQQDGKKKGHETPDDTDDTDDTDTDDEDSDDTDTGDEDTDDEGDGDDTDEESDPEDDGESDEGDDSEGDADDDAGDPAGNNGTVKISPHGELDGIPQNSPHPGCTFDVEWYGFDEGEDVVSTVTFAMQAPTADTVLTVDGPAEVWVGEDAASGAGTDSGLDGKEAYTLSFDGEPHRQQGYHVKLTVTTPHSLGNDTKSKVFWVEACAATGADIGTPASGKAPQVLGVQASAADEESAVEAAAAERAGDDSSVPTSVDAGGLGATMADAASSPWGGLLAVGAGAALLGGAAARRRAGA
ncbi:hypothetical protein ACFP3Q_03430 [Nocardioides sp. GCM10027113]|uniref:hypothetical protein n=1 Tax=unclassified Nocardioides TaxID=2615069 RepID=UPI00360C9819